MPKKQQRDMKSVMTEIRQDSAELDQRLHQTEARRKLALSLVEMRRSAGLTQKEVAASMDRDQAFISRMEATVGPFPSPKSIEAYAHACHAAAGYVFAITEDGTDRVVTIPFGDEREADMLQEAVHHTTHN